MTFAQVLGLVAVVAVLTGVAVARRKAWASRGIRLGLPYPVLGSVQAVAALAVGSAVAVQVGSLAALGAAAFTWLAVLTIATDLTCRLLPREACNAVSLIGIPLLIASWSTPAVFAFGMCVIGLVLLPWLLRIVTRRGLGFGDIRLLTAATLTLSWWVGDTLVLYALVAACVAQVLLHLVTLPWRRRVGDHEVVPGRRAAAPTPGTGDPVKEQPVGEQPVGEERHPRTRRMLPFGPALTLAFTAAAVYSAITVTTACSTWAIANACH